MTYHSSMGADLSFNVQAPGGSALPVCAPSSVLAQAQTECQRRRDAGLAAWSTPIFVRPKSVTTGSAAPKTAPLQFDWSKVNPCDIAKLQPCETQMPTYAAPPTAPPSLVTMPPPVSPPGPPDTTSELPAEPPPTTPTKEPNYLLYGAIGVVALGALAFVAYEVSR